MPIPARPALAGRPAAHPGGTVRERTKEAATTHPIPNPANPRRSGRARRLLRRLPVALVLAAALLVILASPAFAQGTGSTPTLSGVISNLTDWIVGILAGVATLFLTIGGLRYLTAGGDPGQVEKAKTALKSAAIGYALAILAPLIVSILASLVGGS